MGVLVTPVAAQEFSVLGVRVDAVQIPELIAQMEEWISGRDGAHYIAVTNVHVLIEARHSVSFRNVLDSADLCVPDGMRSFGWGGCAGIRSSTESMDPTCL